MRKAFEQNPRILSTNSLAGLRLKFGIFSLGKLHPCLNIPAVKAILIQCAAAITLILGIFVIGLFSQFRFPFPLLVLLQASFSVAFCVLVGMASWWRWIHFCFPLALWGMSKWQVPNDIYLIGFFVSLSLYWTTFRSQVPFYPSRPKVWSMVAKIIPQNKPIRMIDIGSGLGDLSMHIAKTRQDSQIEGIEIAPLPWLISKIRVYITRSNALFKLGDYHQLDFAQYDVVFAYLSPAAMPALWDKVHREMRKGSMLISYEFEIVGIKPSQIIKSAAKSPVLYVWKI